MKINIYAMVFILALVAGCGWPTVTHEEIMQPDILYQYTKDLSSVRDFFAVSAQEINERAAYATEQAKKAVAAIIAVKDTERTFDTIARALDTAGSNFKIMTSGIAMLSYVHPNADVRDAANREQVALEKVAIDLFGHNHELYKVFKSYYDQVASTEQLTDQERYFLDETMSSYKRNGLDLPDDKRAQVVQLEKELGELSVAYMNNANTDASFITATRDELEGVAEDIIAGLRQTEDGNYRVGVDYPTYFAVMEHGTVQETRKRLNKAFQNRAYPKNIPVLDAVIQKRDQLAKLLGYPSFAHLNLDDEMAHTPEVAHAFITELVEKASKKSDMEFAQLTADLAPSVVLSPDGKMYPWDIAFAQAWYKKKHYQLDDRQVSEYFPMQQTIDRLLKIYETFFDLTMKQEHIGGLWVDDLILVTVYTKKDNQLLGYLILDLHPRANKYTHACHIGLVPALLKKDGTVVPALSVVLANFPKPTATKPALLLHDDVKTFFHEFGHAIHEILGATHLADQSGTNVKTDFVEMPSQMLEEWMYDADILKQVSGHYLTREPLPDEMIATIVALKNFSSGKFIEVQSYYSLFSLEIFGPGEHKDVDALRQNLFLKTNKHYEFDPEGHMQAAFGHLIGYGARYYGYLWSKVYALDLFEYIKKYGLLNPAIGTVYAHKVLGKGGSVPPMKLLIDFLGREPNQKAFLKDLGLS